MIDRASRPSGHDWGVTGLLVAAYVLAVALGAVALLPEWWLVWVGVVVLGLALLVGWHARRFAYRCQQCGTVFTVSALVDFVSPQGIGREPEGELRGWKLLRCPACHEWHRATVVRPATSNSPGDRAHA